MEAETPLDEFCLIYNGGEMYLWVVPLNPRGDIKGEKMSIKFEKKCKWYTKFNFETLLLFQKFRYNYPREGQFSI